MAEQTRAATGNARPAGASPSQPAAGPFVINLSSSTTPMALEQPRSPELARFTFFVSRRLEDGRERFRLHMGYFDTATEAEEWLAVVRDVYPAAWVGDAPGKKLRAAQQAATTAAPPPQPARAPAQVPTLRAAQPAPVSPPAPPVARAAVASMPQAPRPAAPTPAASVAGSTPAPRPMTPQRSAPPPSRLAAALRATAPRPAPRPPPARPVQPSHDASLSDTQVLRMLEHRRDVRARGAERPGGSETGAEAIAMLRPDDTQTMRVLKEEVAQNASVAFAVQLEWSVQPIDVEKVPPLAIFSAYTLYTVEGSREGRRWYGLRLGFFSDAISAKQVAYYVRSDFASVAVIPVTAKERERAGDKLVRKAAAAPAKRATEEFKLFDDEPTPRPRTAEPAKPPAPKSDKPAAPTRPAVRKRRPPSRSAPQNLDETLEILGAGDLEIDRSHTLINDSGVRHLHIEADNRRPSTFSKLLDRLADRIKSG
jgi:hypothetical protein